MLTMFLATSSQALMRKTPHSGIPSHTPKKARGTPTSHTVPVSARQANRVSPPARNTPTMRTMLLALSTSWRDWRMMSVLAKASVSGDT